MAQPPRRNPFAEVDCFFASWMRHWRHAETPLQKDYCDFASWLRHCRPRAGRCETPPAGCCASGENEKKPAGKCTFLTGFFLHFHCARGLSFRFPKFRAERSLKYKFSASHKGCRADGPAAGGTGAAQAPAPSFPQATCGKKFGKAAFCIAGWVQGQCPWYRGRGAPCSVTPEKNIFSYC